MPKSLRKNPGWKLEQATIDIVAAARAKLSLTNAEVIDLWANAWQKEQAAEREVTTNPVTSPDPMRQVAYGEVPRVVDLPMNWGKFTEGMGSVSDRPTAARVETPYQIERREKLERLRGELERGSAVKVAAEMAVETEAMTFPFKVLVNGQPHEVIEFKGRRVLECIWPTSRVMMKNLTPQETVIFWKDRVKP